MSLMTKVYLSNPWGVTAQSNQNSPGNRQKSLAQKEPEQLSSLRERLAAAEARKIHS